MDLKKGRINRGVHFLTKGFVFFPSCHQALDGGLEAYPYPPAEAEEATHPPIQITLRLPDHVVYFVDPVVARWDPAGMNSGHDT